MLTATQDSCDGLAKDLRSQYSRLTYSILLPGLTPQTCVTVASRARKVSGRRRFILKENVLGNQLNRQSTDDTLVRDRGRMSTGAEESVMSNERFL
jgi:hypothetical protein